MRSNTVDIMSNFRLDRAALLRAIERGVKRIGRQYETELNTLSRHYKGRPIEEAKGALVDLFSRRGGKITDPELTRYAEQLIAGGKITINVRMH